MALLENERIRLRNLEPEDLDILYRWENDSSLWGIGNTVSPFSRYVLKEYIAESHRDIYELRQLRLMIEWRATGMPAGLADLFEFDPHHRRAGVGILVDALYRQNGVATEALNLIADYAFCFLKLHQLYAHVPVTNEASKTLFSRCGFVVTGMLSEWITGPEGYVDVWVMQRLNKVGARASST